MMVIPEAHKVGTTLSELRAEFERQKDQLFLPDTIFLPPSLYDRAEREGYNMRGYAKQQLIPTGTMHPMQLIPGVVVNGSVMTDEQMKLQYARGSD